MKYLSNLFKIEENYALSNMIIAVGIVAIGQFIAANVYSILGLTVTLFAWIYIFRALRTVNFNRGGELGVTRMLTILMLLWNVFMIIYGWLSHPPQMTPAYIIKQILTGSTFLLPMLFPFILFFKNDRISLRFLFYWFAIFCFIYLLLSPWALWSMTHYSWSMDNLMWGDDAEGGYGDFIQNSTHSIDVFGSIAFTYYCKKYLSGKWWKYFLFATIISLFILIYMARRGGVVMSLGYMLVAYWIYIRKSKSTGTKFIQFVLLLVLVLFGYILFIGLSDSLFSLLIERGLEDSRTGVEVSMQADFDKNPIDYWIGRGQWGTYYDPGFDYLFQKGNGLRWGVETGYLTMIMHGGYIYLGLYLLILIPNGIKGVLLGKNIFVNSLGALILLSVLELYPFGWPTFDFKYLVIWIGVYICSQPYYRNMNDDQIYEQFFKPIPNSSYTKLLNKVMR